ncbi:MAG TPA: T9SS type A sorting domain-containing protein [Chitinophagales bacterium]|nr:T9SS type A sorting domain-containing protein [Chitinophagales bacterium]
MRQLNTFLFLLLSTFTFAQQNPLENTRWGAYMGGPGGGYLAMDYYFSSDTVYGILTSIPMPPTKMFVYEISGSTAMIKGTPNNNQCSGDIDTFSFTIVADTLDFVELSASCPELQATWNPYFFIRTSLSAVKDVSTPLTAHIYPNPAQQTIYVSTRQTGSDACVLSIYNMAGAVVKTERLNSAAQPVDVADLSAGIYIARIQSGNQEYRQKIVIE